MLDAEAWPCTAMSQSPFNCTSSYLFGNCSSNINGAFGGSSSSSSSSSNGASISFSEDAQLPPFSSIFSSFCSPTLNFEPTFGTEISIQAYLAEESAWDRDNQQREEILTVDTDALLSPDPQTSWHWLTASEGGWEGGEGHVGVMEVTSCRTEDQGRPGPSCSSLPQSVLGFNGGLGCTLSVSSDGTDGDPSTEEMEKARRKQLKAELRKERNKAAARKSNQNKKHVREMLEKKSLELWEENLQLQQDIRELTERLRHFRKIRYAMQHATVCQKSRGVADPCP